MLVKSRRNSPIYVDTLQRPLVTLLNAFRQRRYRLPQLLAVILPLLAKEELIQLETAASVTQRVILYIFEEFRVELVLTAHLEEVLDAVEPLMIVEHEEILALLLLRHVPQSLQRVVGARLRQGIVGRVVEGVIGEQGQRVVSRVILLVAPEDVHLAVVEDAVLLLHGPSITNK